MSGLNWEIRRHGRGSKGVTLGALRVLARGGVLWVRGH